MELVTSPPSSLITLPGFWLNVSGSLLLFPCTEVGTESLQFLSSFGKFMFLKRPLVVCFSLLAVAGSDEYHIWFSCQWLNMQTGGVTFTFIMAYKGWYKLTFSAMKKCFRNGTAKQI